jgi:hypothetical protein
MRKPFALIMVSAITLTTKSQYSKEIGCCSHYGISVCAINSGSGYGLGISLNALSCEFYWDLLYSDNQLIILCQITNIIAFRIHVSSLYS